MNAYGQLTDSLHKIPLIKETSIEIYAREIFEWFPNARFLHLVRDPRDNFAALKAGVATYYAEMGEDEKQTLASLIYRTRLGLEMGKVNASRYGLEAYRFVNFNQLVKNVDLIMEELSAFLGIEFTDSLFKPTRLGQPFRGNNFDGNKFSQVSNKNVDRWKERISEDEAQIIEFHLGPLMIEFDYTLSFSREECSDMAADFYKWENYKYFYSDRFEKLR